MRRLLLILLIITLAACGKYAATNRAYKKQSKAYAKILGQYPLKDSMGIADFIGTTNFTMRRANFVIIHHTAQSTCDQTVTTFTTTKTQVSAHYVICRDGVVHHMLNDYLRAHHAGASKWGNSTDLNSNSIGIELDNNGYEPFSEAQINSLISLLGRLKKAFSIPSANFIGHGDIAPTRKNDPNWRFPWKQLADKGFGLWYDDTLNVNVPAGFRPMDAIRLIGYDVKDSAAAKIAFKRHFLQDTTPALNEGAKKILFSLYRKYY